MGSPAVAIEALSKRYGVTWALRGIDLRLEAGEILGYLGPNGAGKTTTIRILLGLVRPSDGRASVFGLDCERDAAAAHRRLASVPGEANLWPTLTGAETLDLLGSLRAPTDRAYRSELVERFGLDVSRTVRDYSRGNRQKVLLVAALMGRPDLLVLDEPTTGLDPLVEQEFRSCVREARARGQAVFLSSHALDEVEALCDTVALVRDGALVEVGTLESMRRLATTIVEARFSGPVPDLSRVPGVFAPVLAGDALRFQVRGPMGPLVEALAGSGVTELWSREPSLEELFVSRYAEPTTGAP